MKETEPFRAALAELKDAEKRAYPTSHCPHCRRYDTLRVQTAEAKLFALVHSPSFERLLDMAET